MDTEDSIEYGIGLANHRTLFDFVKGELDIDVGRVWPGGFSLMELVFGFILNVRNEDTLLYIVRDSNSGQGVSSALLLRFTLKHLAT